MGAAGTRTSIVRLSDAYVYISGGVFPGYDEGRAAALTAAARPSSMGESVGDYFGGIRTVSTM